MSIKFTYLLIFAVLLGNSLATTITLSPSYSKTTTAPPTAAKAPVVVTPTPPKTTTATPTRTDPLKIKKQLDQFTDVFVDELASMILAITSLVTPRAVALKDKILQGLVQIYKILYYINLYPSMQIQFKPKLQRQVDNFLDNLEQIQALMAQQTTVVVEGNNNLVVGKSGYLSGNDSTMVGNKSVLVGNNNTIVGNGTLVSGESNSVKGTNVVAVGKNNNITASNAYAFTNNDTISQNNTLTIGNQTVDLVKLNTKGATGGYLVRE